LFERESVQRHSKKSGAAGQEAASDVEGRVGAGCWWDGGNTSDTLTKCGANGAQRMPDKDNFGAVLQPFDRQTHGSYGLGNVASTCAARDCKSSTDLVAVPYTKSKRAQSDTDDETWVEGQVNRTLSLFDSGDVRATTVAIQAYSIREDAKANNFSATPTDVGLTVSALVPGVQSHHAQLFMAQAMTVRRLLPIECERLQGFPDDYTLIPWRKKAAGDCPDGPRYKALGNSMAVNVVTWIGERIQAVDAQTRFQSASPMDNGGDRNAASPL
jgi:DNA (cytosine-5)-methyltransferase 1